MAETPRVKKQKLKLQSHLHSLSVQFGSSAVQRLTSFPPLYIRLSRGSHSIDSANVSLVESSPEMCAYNAFWEGETLSLPIGMARQTDNGIFETKHLKLVLKIYSEGKSSHKTLASHNFDIASLNLSSLDVVSSSKERQNLVFTIGKNAKTSIANITLDVTFQYSYLPDQSDCSSEEPTVVYPEVESRNYSPPVRRWSLSPSPELETQEQSVQPPHETQEPPVCLPHGVRRDKTSLQPQQKVQGPSMQPQHEVQAPYVRPVLEIQEPSVRSPYGIQGKELSLQPQQKVQGPSLQPQHEVQAPYVRPLLKIQEPSVRSPHETVGQSLSSMIATNKPSKDFHESTPKCRDVTTHIQEMLPNPSSYTSMEVSTCKTAPYATPIVTSAQPPERKEQSQDALKVVKPPPLTHLPSKEAQKANTKATVSPTKSHPGYEECGESSKTSLNGTTEFEAVDGPTGSSHIPVLTKQHKSKAKKLKGFFKIKGHKTKAKSKAAAEVVTKATAGQQASTQHMQRATQPSAVEEQQPTEIPFEEFRKVITRPNVDAANSNHTKSASGLLLESESPHSQGRANRQHSDTNLPVESRAKSDTSVPLPKPKHKSGLASVPHSEFKEAIVQGSTGLQDHTHHVRVMPESRTPVEQKPLMMLPGVDISGNKGHSSILPPKGRRVSEPIISNWPQSSSLIPSPRDIPMKSKRTSVPVQSPVQQQPHVYGNRRPQQRSPELTKLLSGSTPVLQSGSAGSRSKRSSSISDLARPKTSNDRRPSIGDLVRPTRSSTVENILQQKARSDQNFHGILKIRVTGVNVSNEPQGPRQSLTDIVFSPESVQNTAGSQQLPTEGLFCVFTVNGGNSRAETSVQPLVPRRPVIWRENEELLFHTSQSRQIFVMCRKTKLESSKGRALHAISEVSMKKSKAKNDICVGAAVLSIADLKANPIVIDSSTTNVPEVINRQQCEARSLPLQPHGSMLLEACFCAWKPNLKVSCKGTVTLQSLVDVDSHLDHDLSCTVKIDSEFQDCTAVLTPEECATEGWKDEPIEINAYHSQHCDVQIWAYSSEGTEYWCGGCMVPLALILPEEVVEKHLRSSADSEGLFVVSKPYERTVSLPVEPKGILTISFLLYPSPRSSPIPINSDEDERTDGKHEPGTSSDVSSKISSRQVSFSPDSMKDPDVSSIVTRRGSLRKTLSTTLRKAGGFSLKVRKSYTEEPFILQQENTDLKREVEYLREQLRETKANLAESEFFREKLLLELRTSQEELEQLKKQRQPSKGPKTTPKSLNKNFPK